MDERISLRFNGKLLALRMEDANLENIDRVAKAKGQSRSEWMRLAMLTQLAVDLAEIGAPVREEQPPTEPIESTSSEDETPGQEPALAEEPPVLESVMANHHVEMVGAWAPPEEPEPAEDPRPNRWG